MMVCLYGLVYTIIVPLAGKIAERRGVDGTTTITVRVSDLQLRTNQ